MSFTNFLKTTDNQDNIPTTTLAALKDYFYDRGPGGVNLNEFISACKWVWKEAQTKGELPAAKCTVLGVPLLPYLNHHTS